MAPIKGIERFKEIFEKINNKIQLTPEEKELFRDVSAQLREQSDLAMASIAQMLPEEKRGPYMEGKGGSVDVIQ